MVFSVVVGRPCRSMIFFDGFPGEFRQDCFPEGCIVEVNVLARVGVDLHGVLATLAVEVDALVVLLDEQVDKFAGHVGELFEFRLRDFEDPLFGNGCVGPGSIVTALVVARFDLKTGRLLTYEAVREFMVLNLGI